MPPVPVDPLQGTGGRTPDADVWRESAEDWPKKAGAAFSRPHNDGASLGPQSATQGACDTRPRSARVLMPPALVPSPHGRERAACRAHSLRASTAEFVALHPSSLLWAPNKRRFAQQTAGLMSSVRHSPVPHCVPRFSREGASGIWSSVSRGNTRRQRSRRRSCRAQLMRRPPWSW